MAVSIRKLSGSATGLQELSKAALRPTPVANVPKQREKVIVQARYSYDEQDTPSRRPTRPTRSFDEGDFEQRRGPSRSGSGTQSWDEDFDMPSGMDRRSARSRESYDQGGVTEDSPRYSQDQARRSRGDGGYAGRPQDGRGGSRGGTGSGYGTGLSRGRDYQGGEGGQEQQQGGERDSYRRPGRSYGGSSGGGGGGGSRSYGDRGQGRSYEDRPEGGRGGGMSYEQMNQRNANNQAIRDASSWQDLVAFVNEKGPVMDAENASTILFKLAGRNMGRQQPRAAGQAYAESAFSRPRDEAGSVEYDRLLSTLLGWVLVLMPNFQARHCSMCLQSLARLELWNEEVVKALVEACIRNMRYFEAVDLGNIMWSFAKFNYSPGQEFIDAFLARSLTRLPRIEALELSKMSSAMSKLGCVPTPEWAEAFWKASLDNVMQLSDVNTGDILMAVAFFAQSGVQPPQQWVDQFFGAYVETEASRSARMMQLQAQYQQQLDELSRQQKDDTKPTAPPPKPKLKENPLPRVHVINKMLYTLSNLTCKPNMQWFAAAVDAWKRQLQYCSASDLGNIALYLGRYLQVPVSAEVCRLLIRETMKQAGKAQGDDLASVAYLLSASQYKGSDREIDDLVILIKQQLPSCSLSALELIYNALPTIGSGYRLNETVTEAANRYNDLLSQQQAQQVEAAPQEGEAAAAQENEVVTA